MLATLQKKKGKWIFLRFSGQVGYATGNNLDWILYFLGPHLLTTLQKKWQTDFNDIFRVCWTQNNKITGLDCHAQLYWFTVLKLGVVSCLWATVWETWWMDFIKLGGCHTRNNLGTLHLTSLKQHFYLLDPYLLAILRRVNGFSQNNQELLNIANEKT